MGVVLIVPEGSGERYFDVVHVSTAHNSTDNRIYRKECAALQEAGVSVALMSRGPAPQGRVPWLEIPGHSGRLSRMVLGPWNVWRELRRLRPAVVHIHDPELIPLGAMWKARRMGRVVYDAHEDLPKQVMGKSYLPKRVRRPIALLARLLEVVAARNFDAVVVATPPIGTNFAGGAEVVLVQNFPWLRDFPEATAFDQAEVGSLCYVGGLSRIRGSRVMSDAVRSTRGDVTLHIAGRRDAEAAEDLGSLGDHLVDHGVVSPEAVPQIVGRSVAGLVLLEPVPNYVESQPTKMFEYMAAGRAFVASDFPYWRELIGDSECGIFVDPQSPQEVADAVDQLMRDPDLTARLGSNGRDAFERYFTFENEAPRLVAMTHSLLSR
jgi:glycosyltransferase involved in cell wall biosynthesis